MLSLFSCTSYKMQRENSSDARYSNSPPTFQSHSPTSRVYNTATKSTTNCVVPSASPASRLSMQVTENLSTSSKDDAGCTSPQLSNCARNPAETSCRASFPSCSTWNMASTGVPPRARSFSSFKFSETDRFNKSRISSDKTFHKLVERAIACAHVSSNYHDLSLAPLGNCTASPSSPDDVETIIQRGEDHKNQSTPSSPQHDASSMNLQHNSNIRPPSPSSTSSTANQVRVSIISGVSVECQDKGISKNQCDSPHLNSSSIFSSPSMSSYGDSPREQTQENLCNTQKLWPFETFSDLTHLSFTPSSFTRASHNNKDSFTKDASHGVDYASFYTIPHNGICAICLNDIHDIDVLGELLGCNHTFCFHCIMTWADRTNHCPLCKQKFNKISKKKWAASPPERLIEVTFIDVEDKVLCPTDEEDNAIGPINRRPLEEYICQICRDGNHEEVLLLCDGCDDAYHTYCVGRTDIPEGSWYCQSCSAESENPLSSRRVTGGVPNATVATQSGSLEQVTVINERQVRGVARRQESSALQTRCRRTTRRGLHNTLSSLEPELASRRPVTRSISHRLSQSANSEGQSGPGSSSGSRTLRTRSQHNEDSQQPRMSQLEQRIRRRWGDASTSLGTQATSSLVIPRSRREQRHHILAWLSNGEENQEPHSSVSEIQVSLSSSRARHPPHPHNILQDTPSGVTVSNADQNGTILYDNGSQSSTHSLCSDYRRRKRKTRNTRTLYEEAFSTSPSRTNDITCSSNGVDASTSVDKSTSSSSPHISDALSLPAKGPSLNGGQRRCSLPPSSVGLQCFQLRKRPPRKRNRRLLDYYSEGDSSDF